MESKLLIFQLVSLLLGCFLVEAASRSAVLLARNSAALVVNGTLTYELLATYWEPSGRDPARSPNHVLVLNALLVDEIESGAFYRYDPALVSVFLESNRLARLLDDQLIFDGLADLEVLSLASNLIDTVEPGVFHGLAKLQYLNLASNQLEYFHDRLFDSLSALQVLDLSHNRLVYLSEGCFGKLANLRALKLKNNQLKKLESRTFVPLAGLVRLDLSSNRIASINGVFDWTTEKGSLADLNLKQNMISQIPERAFSQHRASLLRLDLSFNRLECVNESSLNELENLTELFLQNNQIRAVEWGSFRYLRSLQTLSLAANQLVNSALFKDTFWNLTRLNYLDISSNRLSKLESNTFDSLKHLYTLMASNNNISRIQPATFVHLSRLDNLDLAGNALADVDAAWFVDLPGLSFLKLDANRIGRLRTDAFRGLAGIKYLSLARNGLSSIDSDAFRGLANLSVLYLDNNDLTSLSDVISGLKGLTSLFVSGNKLRSLGPKPFASTPRLEVVDLSDNQLEQVDMRAFESLSSLAQLNLSSNPLVRVSSAGQNSKCVRTLSIDSASFYKLRKKGKCFQVICNRENTTCVGTRPDLWKRDSNAGSCATKPCRNGATCVEKDSRYRCTCAVGFSGTNCEAFDCNCQNNGTCQQILQQLKYCKCPSAFTGSHCQTPRVSLNLARSIDAPILFTEPATTPEAALDDASVSDVFKAHLNSFIRTLDLD